MAYYLSEINARCRADAAGFIAECDGIYADRLELAADRIIILAGCGVNEQNIKQIQTETGVCEFHFSARVPVKSRMQYINPDVYMGAKDADEGTLMYTSAERVSNTIAQLQ